MQFVVKLIPCPLCITQRFYYWCGDYRSSCFFHQPQKLGRRLYASLGAVLAIIGGGFSSRQVWLQSLPPDQVPACGPDLSYLIENFPLKEAFHGVSARRRQLRGGNLDFPGPQYRRMDTCGL